MVHILSDVYVPAGPRPTLNFLRGKPTTKVVSNGYDSIGSITAWGSREARMRAAAKELRSSVLPFE
jgi:hypothetical protein